MRLEIEKVVYKGLGMGRMEGKVVFVPFSLPGEILDVSITKELKDYSFGVIKSIIKESKFRKQPSCPYFGICGGCHLMHADYKYQIELKRKIVEEIAEGIPIITRESPFEFNVRMKMELPVRREGKLKMGYFMQGTHKIVEIDRCPVVPEAEYYIKSIREELRRSDILPYNEKKKRGNLKYIIFRFSRIKPPLIVFVTLKKQFEGKIVRKLAQRKFKGIVHNVNPLHTNRILGEQWRVLKGDFFQEEKILDRTFVFSFSSFFQTNPYIAEKLLKDVVEYVKGKKVYDLYAGVGLFSVYLASKYDVVAVESNPSAIRDLVENAEINGVKLEIIQGKTEEFIEEINKANTIIVDPPRKGLSEKVIKKFNEMSVERLLYISCNPPVFFRDRKKLNKFRLNKIYLYDMFPNTYHIEILGIFDKI